MKKVGKSVILVILLGCFGIGGFFLGVNTQAANSVAGVTADGEIDYEASQRESRIMNNIKELTGVIERDYIFDYTAEDLENGIYKGLFAGLGDPYSVYYTGEEFIQFNEASSGSFAGIGVVVSMNEMNRIEVQEVIEGGPAEAAGVESGDIITHVEDTPYTGMELEAASAAMRGEAGTDVTITVERLEGTKPQTKDITITRDIIEIDSVESEMLEDNIGYIRIASFDEPTAEEFSTHLNQLMDDGATRLVIDLRNNPGGLLSVTEEIADMLLEEATIVTSVDKQGREEVASSDADQVTDMPIVVLVNENSASASEVLLGALSDNGRATSVGTQTFGKGIIQRVYPIDLYDLSAGGFKLTMAEYLTPNGTRIHEIGITPDTVVELPYDIEGIGPEYLEEDLQLQEAVEQLK